MRVAVTGANGFVGGRTVERLLERGHHVVAFGRREQCAVAAHERLRYRRWDMTEGPVDVGPVDAAVHCAGSVTEWGSPYVFYSANVKGTANVLASFVETPSFVYISTASVYDLTVSQAAITEDSPLATRFFSEYSRTKLLAERLVAKRERDTIVLRPHIVYGPGDIKIMPRLLKVIRRSPLVVPGNGCNRISMTHIDNLTQAIELSIGRRVGHEVFNVADGETATVDQVLRAVQTAFASTRRIFHVPAAAAGIAASASESLHRTVLRSRTPTLTRFLVANLSQQCLLDIGRARAQLEYRPTRSYREALKELADNFKADTTRAFG
jgi:nucleoside-diphosphate-sugar epimerase